MMKGPLPAVTAALFLGVVLTASGAWGETFTLTSKAFSDQGKIPVRYVMPAAGGENVSVPLAWTGVPEGTRSFALAMVDPHPVARNWVHWLVVNIAAGVTAIEEGASGKGMPPGAMELNNSWGVSGYGGPQPPKGTGDHPYVFTLYALSVDRLDLPADTALPAFEQALAGKIIARATVTGFFGQ